MEKIFSSLLALIMAMALPMNQVLANEVTLDSVISDFQYRMTVDWDQQDVSVQQEILGAFAADVGTLVKQGVSKEQMLTALSERVFDSQTSKDILTLAKYSEERRLDPNETQKLILTYVEKSQKMGTSWSGEARVCIVLGLSLIMILIAVIAAQYTPEPFPASEDVASG